ncbi:hypothetical protein BJX70DRAFT_381939 [Aspergillus crustosus]
MLREKADGTSLWVGIACHKLLHVASKDAVKTLERLPKDLDSLYNRLLASVKDHNLDEYNVVTRILSYVAVALRPLRILELAEICQLYKNYDEEVRHSFTLDSVNMCRLLVIVQDNTVSLLHKSLKDFLLRGNGRIVDEKVAHAFFAYRCLDHVMDAFSSFNIYRYSKDGDSFVFYSAQYWPNHAFLSRLEFQVLDRHSRLF